MRADTAVCFDLDGTLTKDEILPRIARFAGLEEEIEALTRATLLGLIPFRKSFLLRVALLKDLPLHLVHEAISEIGLNEEVLRFIEENSAISFIVTGNLDVWIAPLLDKIGCKSFSSIAESDGAKVLGVASVLDKARALKSLKGDFRKIVAVGDGMGDVGMFEEADVRIAFGGAHHPVESLVENSEYLCFTEGTLCRLLNQL